MFVKSGIQFARMRELDARSVDLPTCRAVLYTDRFGISSLNIGENTE